MLWLRLGAKIILVATLAVIVLAVIAIGALQLPPVQRWVLAELNRSMAGEAHIAGLAGTIPTDMQAAQVELYDPAGRWAVIHDAVLQIDPAALLRGRISIGLLAARDLRVDRMPESTGKKQSGGFPLPIELRRLEAPSIELAPAVLGEEIDLAVSGNAAISGARTQAHLDVHRIDTGPGHLEAHLDLGGKPARLHVAMNIDDPSGALLDKLFARKDALPLTVRFDGDGPLADWHGRIEADAGAARVGANVVLSNTSGYRMTLNGDAAPSALLPEALRGIVGDSVRFRVSARQAPNGDIAIGDLQVALAAVTLQGSAALGGGSNGPVKANLQIDVPDLAPLSPMLGRAVGGSAHIKLIGSGTTQEPVVHANVDGTALRIGENGANAVTAQLDAKAAGSISDPATRLSFTGQGSASGLTAAGAPLPGGNDHLSWKLAGSANPTGTTAEVTDLTVEAPGLLASAKGSADRAHQSFAGTLHLTASNLSLLSGLAGRPLSGHGAIDATASDDGTGQAQLHVTGGLSDLSTGIPVADGLLGGRVQIDIAGARAANGDITVKAASVEAANLHVNGTATLDSASNRANGAFAIDLPKLSVLGTDARPVTGRANIDGTITGTATAPRLDAVLNASDVSSGAVRLDRISARLNASKDPAPAGSLDATFRSGTVAGTIKGRFAVGDDGKILDVPGLTFAAAGTTLNASLHTDLGTYLTRGEISVRSADLSRLSSLAGVPLSGKLEVETKLTAEHGQNAAFTVSGTKFSADSTQASRKSIERINAEGRFSDLFGASTGRANVELQNARMGEATIDRVRASTTSRRPGQFVFSGALNGTVKAAIELAVAGDVDLGKAGIAARITEFNGKLGDQTLRLAAPLRLAKSGPDFSFSGLDLALGKGRVTGNAALKGDSVAASLRARDVPLDLAEAFAGKGAVSGTAEAELDVHGTTSAPTGRVAITAHRLRLATAIRPDVPPLDVTAEARLQSGRVALDGRVGLSKGEAIRLIGEVPLRLSLKPFAASVPRNEPLEMRIEGDGQLEDVADLLPIGDDRLSGHYHLDLHASGTAASPNASGQLSLRNGRYESLDYGTELDGITFDLVGNRDRIVLAHFSATDGGDGTLTMTGSTMLATSPAPSLDLAMELHKFQLVHNDEAVAHGSGDLHVTGDIVEPHVFARLRLDDAHIYPPDQLPPNVRRLDVTEIDSKTGEILKQPAPPSTKTPIVATLDVKLDIPGQVFVQGRGLDSEWQGHFDVTGTSSAPQVNGSLQIVRGTMNFLGKTLTLSRGTITLVGGHKIEPFVDFLAESTSGGVTAQVAVTGPADSPTITLTSNPPMPQDQILAQLLFGQDVTQLSPLEGAQIAAAAASLASGGPSVIDRLRMKFGLDRLSIGSATDTMNSMPGMTGSNLPPAGSSASNSNDIGNTTVSAGKYVAPGVYVGVNQSASGESQAQVEVEITRHLDVDTTASATRGNSIGLEWKLDY